MHFTKMEGCGNDYIYIDGSKENVEDKQGLAKKLSDRNFGVGGDGIIFINPGKEAEFENTSVIIPDDPDSVLRVIFGEDYMEPKMFEAGHDYPFYSNQESAFVKMLADSGVTTSVDEFCVNWHKMIGWE